jgi:hypothetical protein
MVLSVSIGSGGYMSLKSLRTHKSAIDHRFLPVLACAFFACLLLTQCSNDDKSVQPVETDGGTYTLVANYDSIRSMPGGGGIFVVRIVPSADFTGSVKLNLDADTALHVSLTKATLVKSDTVTDITINPGLSAQEGVITFTCTASHAGKEQKHTFHVRVMEWSCDIDSTIFEKRELFRNWLVSKNSAYSELFGTLQQVYKTYPQILIVEHYTMLTPRYEFRLCYHVTISPYNWSKIWIRDRSKPSAEFSAIWENSGSIRETAVDEYPIFGY